MLYIFCEPIPTLRERITRFAGEVAEFWCRHVTQRLLYRQLDASQRRIRESRPPDWVTPVCERGLQRIKDAVAVETANLNGLPRDSTTPPEGGAA
ncbi:hypothetical protein ACFYZH_09905 [Streptomyces abikoensis]|uniref:hypothetical protein n=1 Tax=Streptomyces abikoensis TaxID=97398 RepID=UPI0036A8B2D4